MIVKGEEVYTRKDFTVKELSDFVEELAEYQYFKT
jgi:hypothetical protein